jgi:hypothetical protein
VLKSVRSREDHPVLKQRVHPDPAQRGTINQFRRDFEKLFDIRKPKQNRGIWTLNERQKLKSRHLTSSQTIFKLIENKNRLWQAGNESSGRSPSKRSHKRDPNHSRILG